MRNIKESNEYRKVIIKNIVFLRGDDFTQYEKEKESGMKSGNWSDLDYLLQWFYPSEHETTEHYARDINTPFLGKLIKIEGYKGYFLFSKNTSIGYIGLSRIVGFSHA